MSPVEKERLDKLLVDRGLCATRTQAQALIMDHKVQVLGAVVNKPGALVPVTVIDIVVAAGLRYVSRGGLKLEKALSVFGISAENRVCMDVGASTGGFTDCLLQNGASAVIAVDVGYGQLDWKLRTDPRVQSLEKTNIRTLEASQLAHTPSLGVVDTSFISLKKVLPSLSALLTPEAEMMALLKPQFEYRDYVSERGFKGVVRHPDDHQAILKGVLMDLAGLLENWDCVGLDFSPITGPKGNIEFLLYYRRQATPCPKTDASEAFAAMYARIPDIIAKSYEAQPAP